MEQSSPTKEFIRRQVEEQYGKVVYTYETQVIEACLLKKKKRRAEIIRFAAIALTSGGAVTNLFTNGWWANLGTTILAVTSLFIEMYLKNNDFASEISAHKKTSDELWRIREEYITLLTDFNKNDFEKIQNKRDQLIMETWSIYKEAPLTSEKAYTMAQEKLKNQEAQFFSLEELNMILPGHLRH